MASEKDLLSLMESKRKVWTPEEICNELDVDVCELALIIAKANKNTQLVVDSNEATGFTNKIWLGKA